MNKLITWFDQEFKRLECAWVELIEELDSETLYSQTAQQFSPWTEHIVQSARIVEQMFGGITTNLWDDPFEWTLPETLSSSEKLLEYLGEVGATRKRGFDLFQTDADLLKTIVTPAGSMQVMSLLLDTLVRAGHHQLRANESVGKTDAGDNSSLAGDLRS